MVYYPRGLHQQTAYANLELSDEWYPNTIKATKTVLSLPMHPYLTSDQIDLICDVIKENIK